MGGQLTPDGERGGAGHPRGDNIIARYRASAINAEDLYRNGKGPCADAGDDDTNRTHHQLFLITN